MNIVYSLLLRKLKLTLAEERLTNLSPAHIEFLQFIP
jgi:hypothetical protein